MTYADMDENLDSRSLCKKNLKSMIIENLTINLVRNKIHR